VRIALLGGAIAACLAAAAGAQAASRLVLFPTPLTHLEGFTPFATPPTALPNVFRPPIASREVIDVGVDDRGKVTSVQATQRLVMHETADYRLTVPAPVTDVEPGPGSESAPGLRRGAILWQGFSAGRKILSARATLAPAAAAAALPLRVEIAGNSVRLENVTAATATTFSAEGDRLELARILDSLRADPQGRTLGQATYVKVRGRVRETRVRVDAPLRVTGRAAGKSFTAVLGGDRPAARTIDVQDLERLELTVEPIPPAALLRPPRGESWAQAVRLDPSLGGRPLFDHAVKASLTLALVRQYDALLQNPDPLGSISARYLYRVTAAPAPAPPEPSSGSEGLAVWLLALIAAGGAAAAGGLAVIWAHS
jgi:hypothetical protein